VRVLLDSDPGVPQRDLLLDPGLVASRLAVLGFDELESCRQTRVKYRVGARLRVVHRVRTGAATYDVAASTFATRDRSERAYEAARSRVVPCGATRGVVHDRELNAVFWTFPNDRKIAHLPALVEPAPELVGLTGGAWARSVLVAYAPEKAATVRCLDAAGRTLAYAKVYAGEEGARTARVHEALAARLGLGDPHLRVPRSLGYSATNRTLVLEAIEGAPLRAPSGGLDRGYRRLGRGLARLHDLPAPDAARFRRLDPDRIVAAAELIASVRRDVAASAWELAREISRRLPIATDSVCLHGDVNFRNALLEDGRVALIDLDQVASGPAGAELGSVLASVRYAGVVGLVRAEDVPELSSAFLRGYAELKPLPDEGELRAYTAAALLAERALRVVTRVRAVGLRRLPELLAEARRTLS
jgi:aminoglycoside phosphotransferase